MKNILTLIALTVALQLTANSQRLQSPAIGPYRVADAYLIKIVRAEDARDAAPVIAMLTNVNTAAVRYRAALAAGRIGDDKAIDGLVALLKDDSVEVRAMAAFAIGEVESAKGSPAIIGLLDDLKTPDAVLARAVEAAGKIVAANPRDAKSKDLGDAVLDVLDAEIEKEKSGRQHYDTVKLGITAVLRARPNEGEVVIAKFLLSDNARIRADAGNTLTRLRAKNANVALRAIVAAAADRVPRTNMSQVFA